MYKSPISRYNSAQTNETQEAHMMNLAFAMAVAFANQQAARMAQWHPWDGQAFNVYSETQNGFMVSSHQAIHEVQPPKKMRVERIGSFIEVPAE